MHRHLECYSLYFSICLKFLIIVFFKLPIKIKYRSHRGRGRCIAHNYSGNNKGQSMALTYREGPCWKFHVGAWEVGTGARGRKPWGPRGHLLRGSAPGPWLTHPTARVGTEELYDLSQTTSLVGEGVEC